MIFIKAAIATLILAGCMYVALMGLISAIINYKALKVVMNEETEVYANNQFYKVTPTRMTERIVLFKDNEGKTYKETLDTFLDIQEEACKRRKQEQGK